MSEETLQVLFSSIGVIVGALGVPKIFDTLRAYRETKNKHLIKELETEKARVRKLRLKIKEADELRIKLSVIIPFVRQKNKNDPDTLELMDLIEKSGGTTITPASTENEKL